MVRFPYQLLPWRSWRIAASPVLIAAALMVTTAWADRPGPMDMTGHEAEAGEAAAHGEPRAERRSRQRLVRRFDFREPDNFEDMPRNWYAIGREADTAEPAFHRMPIHNLLTHRRGFPAHNEVRFDKPQREVEDNRLYLSLDGGSAGAFLAVGALAAVPQTDYMITARVRTEALEHARARFTAFFVDQHGRRIEGTTRHSPLVDTGGDWTTVKISLEGDYPSAAWISLKAELLQPREQYQDRDEHKPLLEDIDGHAWFDDISIWQVPRIILQSQNRANIIRSPQRPRLDIGVRDHADQLIDASMMVYDVDRRLIDRAQRTIGGAEPRHWQWAPALPRYGWYMVDLILRRADGDRSIVGRSVLTLLYLPNDAPLTRAEDRRFVLDAQHVPQDQLPLIPGVIEQTGMLSVMFSAWDESTTADNIEQRQQMLDEVVQPLTSAGLEVGLGLNPIPSSLSAAVHADNPCTLEVLTQPRQQWEDFVRPVLRQWGQQIRRWQLGWLDEPMAADLPNLAEATERAKRELGSLAPDVRMILPWSAHQDRRDELDPGVALTAVVSPAIQPKHMEPALDALLDGDERSPVALALETPPATHLSHRRRVADMARRMVYGWELDIAGFSMARPWTPGPDRDLVLLPDPLLGVYSQVARRLEGRRVIGWMPIGEGMKCAILDGPHGPMLAAWNDSAPPARANMDMYLGEQPIAIDVWGNRRAVPAEDGRHQLELGQTPVFIEGIDANLAMFRAGFRIEEAFIESNHEVQQRTIHLKNPWPRTINGRFRIKHPSEDEWRLLPRSRQFSIAAGQSAEYPIDVQLFPRLEPAGTRKVQAEFQIDADRELTVDLETPVEVGLRDIELDAALTIEPAREGDGQDAVVTLTVTNQGEDVLSLRAFSNLPGYSRQEDPIPQLMPGDAIMRRFRFSNALDTLRDHPIRTGIMLNRGTATLHKLLRLDDD